MQFPDLNDGHVFLRALRPEDAEGLRQATQDGALWTLVYTSAPPVEQVEKFIADTLAMPVRRAYVVCDAQGKVLGTTSFYRIEPAIKRLLIGYTWYRQSCWRTAVNTRCKLLLLDYAFREWGANIVAFETDIMNTRSQAAIERLGARKDGIIRGDRLRRDGTIRDTVAYSISRAEWPPVHAALRGKLRSDD